MIFGVCPHKRKLDHCIGGVPSHNWKKGKPDSMMHHPKLCSTIEPHHEGGRASKNISEVSIRIPQTESFEAC